MTLRRRGYPGQFAPASLKYAPPRPDSADGEALSGAVRPGLIEVKLKRDRHDPAATVSPGSSLPRRHCRTAPNTPTQRPT